MTPRWIFWRGSARLIAFAIVVALTMTIAPAARGQQTTDNERFARALKHYDRGEYAQAIELWENLLSSLGQTSGWRLLLNLARAYEAVGDPTRAAVHFEAFLRGYESRAPDEKSSAEGAHHDAETRLAALKQRHGAIRIDAPRTGVVFVRIGLGEPRPAGGVTVYLQPGEHEIELFSGTAHAHMRKVNLRAGEVYVVTAAELESTPPSSPPPPSDTAAVTAPKDHPLPAPSDTSSRPFPTTTLVVVGGAALLVTGALSSALYFRAANARDDALTISRDDPRYVGAADDYGGARTLFYVSLSLPAAAIAVTTTILLLTRKSGN